jgi:hypothetical protein
MVLWAPQQRVDPLALSFTLGGLALATSGRVGWAGGLFGLALLTKQSYLVAPLAVSLALWPNRRALLVFAGPLVFGVAIGLLAAQLLSGGWFFWHTVMANSNPFDLEYFALNTGPFLQFNAVPVGLAAALFALRAQPRERVWRAYLVLSIVAALATIGKVGASSNYWLELSAAAAGSIGIVSGRIASAGRGGGPLSSAMLATLVLGALLMDVHAYQSSARDAVAVLTSASRGVPENRLAAARAIAAQPGDLFTDDPALAILSGKAVLYEGVIFTVLAGQGVWDQGPIVEAIRTRRFRQVAVLQPLDPAQQAPNEINWTSQMQAELQANYVLAGRPGGYWLYVPAS